jgi:hypothetical protein
MNKICQYCGREFKGRKENKYCSKLCANTARVGMKIAPRITLHCKECGNSFEVTESAFKSSNCKRFCSTSCSAKWRIKTYGTNTMSEENRKKNSEMLKEKWKDDEFRQSVVKRMTKNNPVYMEGVVEKTKLTKLKNGYVAKNNFKYGNGKISEYEQKVYDYLIQRGFYYNYAIPTKMARDRFPFDKFPNNYKPDFVNLKTKICIEIDGNNHNTKRCKELDTKKDKCLNYLGFKVIRFTHKQIDNEELERWFENNGEVNIEENIK